MKFENLLVMLVTVSFGVLSFSGCDDTTGGCNPSTDICACQKDHADCFDAQCGMEADRCDSNEACVFLSNCLDSCKTEECPDECMEMYSEGEKDLKKLMECSKYNCRHCPE